MTIETVFRTSIRLRDPLIPQVLQYLPRSIQILNPYDF